MSGEVVCTWQLLGDEVENCELYSGQSEDSAPRIAALCTLMEVYSRALAPVSNLCIYPQFFFIPVTQLSL